MYNMLRHAHSGLRWIALALLVAAILSALIGWMGKKEVSARDILMNKWAMILVHIQVLIGLVLYFISPKVIFAGSSMKDSVLRFFLVEHLSLMLIAAVLITIGHARQKRKELGPLRHKTIFWFYAIGFLLILAGIPWPWQGYGTGWF